MKLSSVVPSVIPLARVASAGTVLWDGRFNDLSSSEDLNDWSWSSQVGPYQYYIHGSGNVTEYVNLSPDYKNPADTSSVQGAKITLDSTAYWEGQTMRRTELIPQTTAAINSGKVYYHLSLKRSDVNPPAQTREHQIAFFESHFTEMKAGWLSGESGTTDAQLRWMANSQTQWNVTWDADVWHNIAYEIDFSANTVGFWHSTGSNDLALVVSPVSASTSSNGADFHVGVLELPRDGYEDAVEDLYFSGVYIESGDITTVIGGGSSSANTSTTGGGTTTAAQIATSTTAILSTTQSTVIVTTPAPTTTVAGQSAYAQCGGSGWSGPTACATGTCSVLNSYYAQCLP